MMMMPLLRSSGAERRLLLLVGRSAPQNLSRRGVQRPPFHYRNISSYHAQEQLQSSPALQERGIGGSRSFSSTTNTEDSNILQAEVVRERPASSSRVVLRQAQEELSALEQALQEALSKHEQLVAEYNDDTDENNSDNEAYKVSLRRSLEELRDCYENLNYWEDALTIEQGPLQDLCQTSNDTDRAACLYRQGKLHMRMQCTADASKYYQQALALYRTAYSSTSGDDSNNGNKNVIVHHADIGNIMISMAGVHFHRDKLDLALSVLIEAEDHFRKHGQQQQQQGQQLQLQPAVPHWDLVKCLQHQGLVYRMQEDFESALVEYQEALEVMDSMIINMSITASSIPDDADTRRQSLQMDIADMHAALDEADEALEMYETIMQEDREGREDPNEETALDGVMLHNMGKIRAQRGQREQALVDLTKAAEIKERFAGESSPEVGKTLDALGAVHAVTGDKAKALECFQRSLLIARMHSEAGDTDSNVMLALRNISVLKGKDVPKWGSDDN
jgi:tetratricopeptide (TPR) repeat protein